MYLRKCLLMFYNAYAKSVMDYGILGYGAADKMNLTKNGHGTKKNFESIFSKER